MRQLGQDPSEEEIHMFMSQATFFAQPSLVQVQADNTQFLFLLFAVLSPTGG